MKTCATFIELVNAVIHRDAEVLRDSSSIVDHMRGAL